jgi:hypothetical protein
MISPKILLPLSLFTFAAFAEAKWQHPQAGPVMFAEGEEDVAKAGYDAAPKLPDALNRLKEHGIITDTEYWLANARRGKTCEGGMVAEVMITAAKKFEPSVTEIESAVDVLMANKVLQNKDNGQYWKKKAVTGTKCTGSFVSNMLIGMSDVL